MDTKSSLEFLQKFHKLSTSWNNSIAFNEVHVVKSYRETFELQFVAKMMQILCRPLEKTDDGFFDNGHIIQIFLAMQSWYFDDRIELRRTNMTLAMMNTYKNYLNHYNYFPLFLSFINTNEVVMLPVFDKEAFLKKVVSLYQKKEGSNYDLHNLLHEELNSFHNVYTLHIMKHVAKIIHAFMHLESGENFYTIFKVNKVLREENERLVQSTYIFREALLDARTKLEKAVEYLLQ